MVTIHGREEHGPMVSTLGLAMDHFDHCQGSWLLEQSLTIEDLHLEACSGKAPMHLANRSGKKYIDGHTLLEFEFALRQPSQT
jgi:hypothetical protein